MYIVDEMGDTKRLKKKQKQNQNLELKAFICYSNFGGTFSITF